MVAGKPSAPPLSDHCAQCLHHTVIMVVIYGLKHTKQYLAKCFLYVSSESLYNRASPIMHKG